MTTATVEEMFVDKGTKLHIHPSHNVPGDTTAEKRLDEALSQYKRRITEVWV